VGLVEGRFQRSAEILVDAFGRVREIIHDVVPGLTPEDLSYRINDEANSIAWLVWHLTRIQDDHVSDVAETEQVWMARGWNERFGLPFPARSTGYGQSSTDVAAVRVSSGDLLTGYYDEVHDATIQFLQTLTESDFERIVDRSWDPPVTLAVRLVSVISDDLQHAGQAALIAGIVQRRRRRPGS
jgi:hypothetical protein